MSLEAIVAKLTNPLVLFGLAGQFVFMLRFVVQWFSSERRGRSHVPLAFWYLSLLGGAMLMIYGVLDADPVIILGQGLGLAIYVRNLVLIHRRRARYVALQTRRAHAIQAHPQIASEPDAAV
jgi:lipid-A-disaccharide synthase-like uncharacterized protein